jgi:hypothetical protein
MNFMMKAGMNQLQDQAKSLIPSEMQDKKEEGKDGKNLEGSEKGKLQAQKKPKKKNPITKSLAIKMYSILFFHTLVVTVLLFVFVKDKDIEFKIIRLIIFLACFCGGIILSMAISNISFLSKIFFNYILWLVLLAANIMGFICCAKLRKELPKLIKTLFITFDAGSLTIIIFSLCVKDTPSTFWLMCSSSGGIIIAILAMAKIYNDNLLMKWSVLLFGFIGFGIYEAMNYNALDVYKKNSKEAIAPSIVTLPYELNVCFIKVIWYVIKIIGYLCSMCFACCCTKAKRRK